MKDSDQRSAISRQPRAYSLLLIASLSGCGVFEKARRADELAAQARTLTRNLADAERSRDDLQQQLAQREQALAQARAEKTRVTQRVDELQEAKERLARDLQQQIGEYKARIAMTERGLVITFLSEIFFDSGSPKVKPEGYGVLDKVSEVLATTVKDHRVAIEGHTDNEPIKHSGWPSNWELSAHRALAVLHYFVDTRGLPPARFQGTGFGEYRPVAPNDTPQGRQQNRRVEVVILPRALTTQGRP